MNVQFIPAKLEVTFSPATMDVSTGTPVAREYVQVPFYEGDYDVTPSAEAQTLPTSMLRMHEDLVIGAIPDNYGLITWNGSVLTVS